MVWFKKNRKPIFIAIALIITMTLACLLVYLPFKKIFNDPTLLKHQLDKIGIWGKVFLSLIMTIQVILVFLPGEIIEVAAGFCYGTYTGLLICLSGAFLGSLLIYKFIKNYGVKFVTKFYNLDKLRKLAFLNKEKNLTIILFIIFFMPGTPKDLLTYFAPFTKIKLSTFLIVTTLARVPSIITSTLGGQALSSQNYQFTIIIFIVTGIISLLGLITYQKYINNHQNL